MQDPGNRLTTDEVVVKIGVDVGGHNDAFPQWCGSIIRNVLLGVTVAGLEPVMCPGIKVTVVWFFQPNPNHATSHLPKVSEDVLDSVEVTLTWSSPEPG